MGTSVYPEVGDRRREVFLAYILTARAKVFLHRSSHSMRMAFPGMQITEPSMPL
jgi:hypothetical protein